MNRREWARQQADKLRKDEEAIVLGQATEPTDEQLENLCFALGLPNLPPAIRPPYWRQSMLNLHKIVQGAIDGDANAERTLLFLRDRFS